MRNREANQPAPAANCPAPSGMIRKRIGEGLILGASFGLALDALNIRAVVPGGGYSVPFFAMCGAGVMLTRARLLLWLMNAVVMVGLAVIAYTPLMDHLMRHVERSDPPGRAPAVVVLSNYVFKDGTLNTESQDRVLHGLEILRQGEAYTLVLTRPADPRQWSGAIVRAEMRAPCGSISTWRR